MHHRQLLAQWEARHGRGELGAMMHEAGGDSDGVVLHAVVRRVEKVRTAAWPSAAAHIRSSSAGKHGRAFVARFRLASLICIRGFGQCEYGRINNAIASRIGLHNEHWTQQLVDWPLKIRSRISRN